MSDKVVPLFPGRPNAIELFADGTNVEVEELSDAEVQALEEIQQDGQMSGVASMISASIANQLMSAGYDINEYPKDYCLIIESIISMLMQFYDRDHTLQQVADGAIYIEDEDQLIYQFIQPKVSTKDTQDDNS